MCLFVLRWLTSVSVFVHVYVHMYLLCLCVCTCVCVCVCVYVQGEVDTMIIPSTADWDNSGYAWWDSSSISSGGAGMYV